MSEAGWALMDGNEAAASIAYKFSEVIAIYPITPSSPMGEWADQWAHGGKKNLWDTVPVVQEMQSEAGVAGALHGALQAGALATTFTSSQGLLLMIPDMYKIAGELLPAVIHVAARSLATHALSIFGDHSDVMAARGTGFAMLASSSVQQAQDMALIAHATTYRARLPFVHFFDGFRTSHEIAKIQPLSPLVLKAMADEDDIRGHRARALSPDRPMLKGTSQNPDVFFQSREASNLFYISCPGLVQRAMDQFGRLTGRNYDLFEYFGAPGADRVIVIMGSGAETVRETVEAMNAAGERVGVLNVRLYRPFSIDHFVGALPMSVKTIAVLDRCKEPGASGEPLYLDVVNALNEARQTGLFAGRPRVFGGRYGLSSKEFTPAMVKGVYDELRKDAPKNHFTVGISDDVTLTSLAPDLMFDVERPGETRALFYGLGSDGTVSANKNSIKIIGELTDLHAQAYFVYDSKKAGTITVSHLRFGPNEIRSAYLVDRAHFLGCHQFGFLKKYDFLGKLLPGGTFLLNSPYGPGEVWEHLPPHVKRHLLDKKPKLYVIDAYRVAKDTGMGGMINTIMQTCFFAVSGLLPREKAVAAIKEHIKKEYGRKGDAVVEMNYRAVDRALDHLHQVALPSSAEVTGETPPAVPAEAPEFVRKVLGPAIAGFGDELPVSAFPPDGAYPVGTARWEKRNIAHEIPVWDDTICIQCGKCVIVCPHAAIRMKVYDPSHRAGSPEGFKAVQAMNRDWSGMSFSLQVAPENCTGCAVCVNACPAKNKTDATLKSLNMRPQAPLRERERVNWEFFLRLPEADRARVKPAEVRSAMLFEPLFEFSGACAGCGETPYLKTLSQLFGDRALVANATGCSSIYGGNLPTTPWTKNADGRGPAWCNSLFEDNAEFGLGLRVTLDQQRRAAGELLGKLSARLGDDFAREIQEADQSDEAGLALQRGRIERLKAKLAELDLPQARRLEDLADTLVRKSVWIVGGDGWAYDIGFGGLDHVLASDADVNILVLDTEVYSNTGGQMSKSTPRGAVARFASGGKPTPKKDLAAIAMTYSNAYVAQVALGARDDHALKAFLEAEAHPGPSLIIAYSPCIAHGVNLIDALALQKSAVASGHWLLFRRNPALAREGKNPLQLDSPRPSVPVDDFFRKQGRFRRLMDQQPDDARRLLDLARQDAAERRACYEKAAAAVPAEGTPRAAFPC